MKIASIVTNVIFILLFIPVIVLLIIVEFFKGLTVSELVIPSFYYTLPFVMIMTQITSWVLFAKGNYKAALWIALVPIINITLVGIHIILYVK